MKLKINSSVGKDGKNNAADVKVVKALLNVYARNNSKKELAVNGTNDEALEAAITDFQKVYQKNPTPDGQVTSSASGTFKALIRYMKSSRTIQTVTAPKKGAITWGAEGTEGGRYHSRVLHVPSDVSGLTLGRGYDMKHRSAADIKKDLIAAGVDAKKSEIVSKAATLHGAKARQFIIDNDQLDFEISAGSQLKLFETVFKDYEKEAKRLATKNDVEKAYGKVDWEKLDQSIKEVLVDLTFRGDYTGSARKIIQKSVADNDFDTFKKKITEQKNWAGWPKDRYERRKEFLEKAAKAKKQAASESKGTSESSTTKVVQPTGTPE